MLLIVHWIHSFTMHVIQFFRQVPLDTTPMVVQTVRATLTLRSPTSEMVLLDLEGLFSISPVAILYQSLGSFTFGTAPVESFGTAPLQWLLLSIVGLPHRSRYLPIPYTARNGKIFLNCWVLGAWSQYLRHDPKRRNIADGDRPISKWSATPPTRFCCLILLYYTQSCYCIYQHGEQQSSWIMCEDGLRTLY